MRFLFIGGPWHGTLHVVKAIPFIRVVIHAKVPVLAPWAELVTINHTFHTADYELVTFYTSYGTLWTAYRCRGAMTDEELNAWLNWQPEYEINEQELLYDLLSAMAGLYARKRCRHLRHELPR